MDIFFNQCWFFYGKWCNGYALKLLRQVWILKLFWGKTVFKWKLLGKMTYKACQIEKKTIEVGKLWKWQVGSFELKTNYHIWGKD